MIDASLLLKDLQGELGRLSADLFDHVREDEEVRGRLEGEWRKAFDTQRTGRTFEDWLDDRVTQIAVAWLLSLVFVRFCEDNRLVDEARLGGTGVRGGEARDAQQRFFTEHPHLSDRDYVHQVLRSASALRGLDGVIGEGESPLWLVDPPADAVTRALALFRTTDAAGDLRHDFTDPDLSTRFLGDLYQDLSEHAKSTYALLQTPEFVEEFILDRTLTPAIETFGLAATTMIDPTCGSGHFLLGGFHRLFEAWRTAEPGVSPREHAERSLRAVSGVDLNPFAAAIASFRLLVAALIASGERRLADVPDLDPDVAVGDSLLWGARTGQLAGMEEASTSIDRQFLYATEHADELRRIFNKRYAAVVGNPPYITVKDKALNQQYRDRYRSCHRQYSLGVPFTERFFELALQPDGRGRPAGYVGMITANSFMKREFGKKLIEQFIPTWDLTHVIDTSGAYIPGHGTPTVILIGRHQRPVLPTIRTVMGIRGEPSQPLRPEHGLVWSEILHMVDQVDGDGLYVSVGDTNRSRFGSHPWSIGGGGAAELKDLLETRSGARLGESVVSVGSAVYTRCDEVFVAPPGSLRRSGVSTANVRRLVEGQGVRDWSTQSDQEVLFPYDSSLSPKADDALVRRSWPFYRHLIERRELGGSQLEIGLTWFEFNRFLRDRFVWTNSLTFSNVSTHNHFAPTTPGDCLNAHAPQISLLASVTDAHRAGLLQLLNSSTCCFWMKQQFHGKGNGGVNEGYRGDGWEEFFEFDGTKLRDFPVAASLPSPLRGRSITDAAVEWAPIELSAHGAPSVEVLHIHERSRSSASTKLVSMQEELDWECLHLYGLVDVGVTTSPEIEAPPLNLGERAFEIVMARRMAAGELETAWFERHGSTPIIELPAHWPDWYRDLVNERIRLIETDRDVGLIERPEHKRRWAREPWEKQQERALREWLQNRLEARALWFEGSGDQERAVCRSIAQLTDRVLATDSNFLEVARLWKGVVEIDPVQVVTELVAEEHVPAQAGARYKGKGFDKRRQWMRTWELQKLEDDGQPLPEGLDRIPVPPRYTSAEFAKPTYWRHRGKLDVPKERFTSIWGAESEADGTMVLAWAGFDHVQLTQAIGAVLVDRQQTDGWDDERSWPLVAAMAEQLFWLDLWHHDHDPRWGDSPANLFRSMVTEQANRGGRTPADAADWRAPAPTRGRKKKDGA